MERPVSASRGAGRAQRAVREEGAVVDRVVDAHELLVLDVPGAHREMADLAVPHDPVRQSDGPAARLERRVWVALPQRAEPRRLRARHGIRRSIGGDPPSIQDAQHDRAIQGTRSHGRPGRTTDRGTPRGGGAPTRYAWGYRRVERVSVRRAREELT